MDGSLNYIIQDEELIFDCRRVVFWPRKKTLIAADLHWGKTQFLRNHGIAISDEVLHADLTRLGDIIEDYQAETLLVLGDLLHHEGSLTHGIIEKIAYFRNRHPCELILVKGNHDRFAKFPESWGIVEEPFFYQNSFSFHHELQAKEPKFQFAGHIHPKIRLKAGHDMIRVPSYIISPSHCLLPAFSHFTGGQDIKLKPADEAILILGEGLEILKRKKPV